MNVSYEQSTFFQISGNQERIEFQQGQGMMS